MSQQITKIDNNTSIANLPRTELDVQISTAKAYPREWKESLNKASQIACMDEEMAAECFYSLPRKDQDGNQIKIEGPSIRLAEIMMSCWHNIHAATRIIENTGRHVIVEGAAWDLENNTKISKQMQKNTVYKDGKPYNADMQTNTINALSSIALRNALFGVIPKVLVDRVLDEAKKKAVGDQKTISKRRLEIFERLEKLGLQRKDIFAYFKKEKIEEFTADDLTTLIGIGTSIKEGTLNIDNAFNPSEDVVEQATAQKLDQIIQGKQSQKKNDGPLERIVQNNAFVEHQKLMAEPLAKQFEELKERMKKAATQDQLDLIMDEARDLPEERKQDLNLIYKSRSNQINK